VVIKERTGPIPFSLEGVIDANVVAEIPPLPAPGQTSTFWKEDPASHFRAEIAFVPPVSEQMPDIRPDPTARVVGGLVWTLCALQIIKAAPVPGGGDIVYHPSDVDGAVVVAFLNNAGKLRAPKTSVTILAESTPADGSPGETIVAGYGRLSDDSFDPVRPHPVANGEIEWRRTAGLKVLHRAAKDASYQYDVVAYGSGGEVFPTEQGSLPTS
jgi:hypothetical protein